jgi:hypothetical protein
MTQDRMGFPWSTERRVCARRPSGASGIGYHLLCAVAQILYTQRSTALRRAYGMRPSCLLGPKYLTWYGTKQIQHAVTPKLKGLYRIQMRMGESDPDPDKSIACAVCITTRDHGRRHFDCSVIHRDNGARNLKLLPRRGFRMAPESSFYFHAQFDTLCQDGAPWHA